MKTKLIILFTVIGVLSFQSVFAQWESVMETMYFSDGKLQTATKNTHYAGMEGSPYFYDSWQPGEATLVDGKTYKGLLLKYNEFNGTVLFKYNLTDSAMIFQYRPVEFRFEYINNDPQNSIHFLSGFAPVDNANTKTFYQILTDGKVKLLKRETKEITQHQDYSNATSKTVTTNPHYYLLKNDKLVLIKTNKKSILDALPDEADKIKQLITDGGIDLKNDADLIKVVEYYNQLTGNGKL